MVYARSLSSKHVPHLDLCLKCWIFFVCFSQFTKAVLLKGVSCFNFSTFQLLCTQVETQFFCAMEKTIGLQKKWDFKAMCQELWHDAWCNLDFFFQIWVIWIVNIVLKKPNNVHFWLTNYNFKSSVRLKFLAQLLFSQCVKNPRDDMAK